MARIRVTHTIGNLERDLDRAAASIPRKGARVVSKNINAGARLAKANATRTAGAHGKHYPDAIDAEMTGALVGEYGPDAGMPQGGMSFEFGSRNQPPHLDLNKSADVIAPKFAKDAGDILDGLL